MKYIHKNIKNEPNNLKSYRSTPNARYSGFTDSDTKKKKKDNTREPPLKTTLCKEQGFICCYCMRRITPNQTTVEHFIPQKRHHNSPYSMEIHQQHELDFMNMLASCNDKSRNCSETRGNAPLSIDPRNQLIETQIGFQKDGVAFAINQNETVHNDLAILKLGIKIDDPRDRNSLKNLKLETKSGSQKNSMEYWLIKNRATVIEKVRNDLNRKGWTKAIITQEIADWETYNTEGMLREYCQVAVYYLKKKLERCHKTNA